MSAAAARHTPTPESLPRLGGPRVPTGEYEVRDIIAVAEADTAAAMPHPNPRCAAHAALEAAHDQTRALLVRALGVLDHVDAGIRELREEGARRRLIEEHDAAHRAEVEAEHRLLVADLRAREAARPYVEESRTSRARTMSDIGLRVRAIEEAIARGDAARAAHSQSRDTGIRWTAIVVAALMSLLGVAVTIIAKGCA